MAYELWACMEGIISAIFAPISALSLRFMRCCLPLLLLFLLLPAQAQSPQPFALDAARLDTTATTGLLLPTTWETPAGSVEASQAHGPGWFTLPLTVDSSLIGVPLGLRLQHYGAAEIYLNDALLHRYGVVGEAGVEQPATHTAPLPLVFSAPGRHALRVRYSNAAAEELTAVGYATGFTARLGHLAPMQAAHAALLRSATAIQFGLAGMYVVFAVLHLFLFAFYPQRRENLYFAVVAICIGLVLFNNFHEALFYDSPNALILIRRGWAPLTLLTVLTLLRQIYAVYALPTPRHYWVLVGIGVGLALYGWFHPTLGWWPPGGRMYAYAYALVIEAEMLRTLLARRQRPDLFALSVGALILAYSYPMLVVTGLLPPFIDLLLFPNVIILGWLITTSLYLSRGFAQTNAALQKQLAEVTRLSEEKLAQERALRAQEIEQQRMATEYEQKLKELEEARELQLSLLPKEMPDHPEVELAAYMQTATEVGGDYYDFAWDEDGALTLAVGDATGHGMKAGTMVIATKSLFNLLGGDRSLLKILGRTTRALKQLNMRQLYMALTLARYERGQLHLATAGMPPTLIYRAATRTVEAVELKGMPLGSFVNFPYQDASVTLTSGDTVLFMSDGLPELFNEAGDMLGYDTARTHFAEVGDRPPAAILEHLVETARTWRGTRPQDDDMTFVVMQVREA